MRDTQRDPRESGSPLLQWNLDRTRGQLRQIYGETSTSHGVAVTPSPIEVFASEFRGIARIGSVCADLKKRATAALVHES